MLPYVWYSRPQNWNEMILLILHYFLRLELCRGTLAVPLNVTGGWTIGWTSSKKNPFLNPSCIIWDLHCNRMVIALYSDSLLNVREWPFVGASSVGTFLPRNVVLQFLQTKVCWSERIKGGRPGGAPPPYGSTFSRFLVADFWKFWQNYMLISHPIYMSRRGELEGSSRRTCNFKLTNRCEPPLRRQAA